MLKNWLVLTRKCVEFWLKKGNERFGTVFHATFIFIGVQVLMVVKSTYGLSQVFIATDMGNFGAAKRREKVFDLLNNHILKESKGVSYSPSSDKLDRGVVALVDMTLISGARHLITAGGGTFQEWVTVRFLGEHRNDRGMWSKTTICT